MNLRNPISKRFYDESFTLHSLSIYGSAGKALARTRLSVYQELMGRHPEDCVMRNAPRIARCLHALDDLAQANAIKTICMECKRYVCGPEDAPPERTSHGVCTGCAHKRELDDAVDACKAVGQRFEA